MRGQRRRSRNAGEPELTFGVPLKPTDLSTIESHYWDELVRSLTANRTLSESLAGILAVTCSYYEQFMQCRKACSKSSSYRTLSREGAKVWKLKPEALLMNQAKKG